MQPETLSFVRRPAVNGARGMGNTSLHYDIKQGLWTEPVKIGRAALWPRHEVDALNAARLAGKSPDEIRTLVQQLTAARKDIAERYMASLNSQKNAA